MTGGMIVYRIVDSLNRTMSFISRAYAKVRCQKSLRDDLRLRNPHVFCGRLHRFCEPATLRISLRVPAAAGPRVFRVCAGQARLGPSDRALTHQSKLHACPLSRDLHRTSEEGASVEP